MLACRFHQPESVPLLIEAGADVNLVDNEGRSALMSACRFDLVDFYDGYSVMDTCQWIRR